jgi:hypothetical protein
VEIQPLIRFKMGQVLMTPGAMEALQESGESSWKFLTRHVSGDFGDLSAEDKELNEQALEDGSRILSAYSTAKGKKLWVITEADRSATTILLPDEY